MNARDVLNILACIGLAQLCALLIMASFVWPERFGIFFFTLCTCCAGVRGAQLAVDAWKRRK